MACQSSLALVCPCGGEVFYVEIHYSKYGHPIFALSLFRCVLCGEEVRPQTSQKDK